MIRFNTQANNLVRLLVFALILVVSNNTTAESGDAEAGKQKSATCTACHGTDGNSPLDQFPKIAGQAPGYVAAQLALFKSGERENAVMLGMAAPLSEQDMLDLDAYYASQSMTPGSVTTEQEEMARAGETIYRGGIAEFSVPACMGCHGPSGSGILPNYPRLGGQHAAYIETRLLAYKNGTNNNPVMQTIAFPLSEQQIKQLSLYISGLQ